MYENLAIALGLFGAVTGGVSLVLSGVAVAICVGLKNSTHRIQYVPLDNPFTDDETPEVDALRPDVGNGTNPFTKERRLDPEELHDNYDEALLGGDWSNKR